MQRVASFRRLCALVFLMIAVVALSGCRESKLGIRGTILVDGKPADGGMIHFEGVNQEGMGPRASAGAVINSGSFEITARQGLKLGAYKVTISPTRKTGRKVTMPLRGELDEVEQIEANGLVQEITISRENAQKIEINLTSIH